MERIKSAIEKARELRGVPAADMRNELRHPPGRTGVREADTRASRLAVAHEFALDAGHLENSRIVALDPGNPSRLAIDLLRTQVLHRMAEKGWKTLAVTSPTVNSGKTVVAV